MTHTFPRFMAVALLGLALMGCPHEVDRFQPGLPTASLEPVPQPLPADEERPPFTTGPGDLLAIQVSGIPASRSECQVTLDGNLTYVPGACTIMAEGKTLGELSAALSTACARFFRDPLIEISVIRVASAQCIVLGEVTAPGPYLLSGDERLLDLLSKAGGMLRRSSNQDAGTLADLQQAVFIRQDRTLPVDFVALVERGDQKHNIRIHPGDYIYIPNTLNREFFVLGAVNSPGIYRMRGETNLARALAIAGGHTRDAYLDRALLVRGSRSQPIAGKVDLQGVLTGRLADIPLERGDILYLPGRTSENPRFWLDSLNYSFTTTAAERFASDLYDRVRNR